MEPEAVAREGVGVQEADELAARALEPEVARPPEAELRGRQQGAEGMAEAREAGFRESEELLAPRRIVEHVEDLVPRHAAGREQGELRGHEVEPPVQRHDDAGARRGRRLAECDLLRRRGLRGESALRGDEGRAEHLVEDRRRPVGRQPCHAERISPESPGSRRCASGTSRRIRRKSGGAQGLASSTPPVIRIPPAMGASTNPWSQL